MKCYIIIYDLKKQRSYESLGTALKSFTKWGRLTESTWAILSHQSAGEIRDYLRQFLDKDDRLFIVKSGGEAAWQNAVARNEWIKENLPKV